MTEADKNLAAFIGNEKSYFLMKNTGNNWDSPDWKAENWLYHRGSMQTLPFRELEGKRRYNTPLPEPYSSFAKALAIYIQRTKNAGFISIHKYLIECRRLFDVMKIRNENSVVQLTRWHFEQCVEKLMKKKYKNLYDAVNNLQVISNIIDNKKLSHTLIEFKHTVGIFNSRHDYVPMSVLGSDNARKHDEKLPSYEAMKAYSYCTNNPIDADEEILLRTIDLLIAMGQRGNEISLIPLDCWVEFPIMSKANVPILDAHGAQILKTGIRYYAEKKFTSRVHWLSQQDIPLARRAVTRLKILTEEVRHIAEWQECNDGRLWNFHPDEIIEDTNLVGYFSSSNFQVLHIYLKTLGAAPVKSLKGKFGRIYRQEVRQVNYPYKHFYRAGDIEELIQLKYHKGNTQLKVQNDGKWKALLTTSQLLCIKFLGSRSKQSRKNKLVPERVKLIDINIALGAIDGLASIFDIRSLTEIDGSRISITSHQPRHWRNTLYELAGMSNVQQALAMGRQRLDQNATYQHTSILERTTNHRDYLSFTNPQEKIQFLHNGIRDSKILGEVTTLYHKLKEEKGKQLAETFLSTHAGAIHLTPFGGCTHDFSQTPCPKHLQCWNGCSHLHRTNTPGESERIQEQIELGTLALEEMRKDSDGDYGADVWINDLQEKVGNMQKALDIKPLDKPVKVFPNGVEITKPNSHKKGSSVSKD